MEKITKNNCEGMCYEQFCSNKHTHFTNQEVCGLKVHLPFCEKHAEEFEDNLLNAEKATDEFIKELEK